MYEHQIFLRSGNISCLTLEVTQFTIKAKSVGPLRRISDFPHSAIFNVDPNCTGAASTIKRNIETAGGKGQFHFWD